MDLTSGKKLLTRAEYHELGRLGILTEDDRVELIEGEVIRMAPIGLRHTGCCRYLNHLLGQYLGRRALVDVQNPIVLSDITEPQPDVTLLRWRDDFYRSVEPQAADVLALVELVDTTHAHDRRKARLYGAAGVAEVWLVDLRNKLVEIRRQPTPQGYALIELHHPGEQVAFAAFPDLPIAVSDLLDVRP